MDITYKNNKIRRVCTDIATADRTYGPKMTEKIHQRLDEIRASDSVESMIKFHIGRCHALMQDRRGQYAMDLIQPYRLIFEKNGAEAHLVNILEIVDYH